MTTSPTINPSGTPGPALLLAYTDAVLAARNLLDKLLACTPRPCDYPGDTLDAAQNEHAQRLLIAQDLQIELLVLLDGIQEQLDGPQYGQVMRAVAERLLRQ